MKTNYFSVVTLLAIAVFAFVISCSKDEANLNNSQGDNQFKATSCGQTTTGYYYCCNGSATDPDSDGWGWENSASCIVKGSKADPGAATTSSSSGSSCGTCGSYPICCSSSSDPEGDGWGWENSKTCLIKGSSAAQQNCSSGSSSSSSSSSSGGNYTGGSLGGNGVNLQPSYYNSGNPNLGLSLMKQQSKIKNIRLEIEPDKVTQAKSWISQLKSNGYNIICSYHKASVMGSDNAQDLMDAANWWKTNYSSLGGGFTVNLMNEWGSHNISASAFASACNNAIKVVRQVYSGKIIIDIPGYGQETYTMVQALKSISDANIALSVHYYPSSWNQARSRVPNTSDIDELIATGKTIIVGEFGNQPSGNCDWAGIIDYSRNKGINVLGWCWNGDGGSMNMVSPTWVSNPTATSFSLSSYFSTIYNHL